MFERFDEPTRRVVLNAAEEAHGLRRGFIGPEHLLLSLAAQGTGAGADALAASGLEAARLRAGVAAEYDDPLDADVLRSLGIDLDAVRQATEAAFGPGALDRARGQRRGHSIGGHPPFTPAAKKSLALALREAVRAGQHEISSGHLLLGILRAGDRTAVRALTNAGVDIPGLRDEVIRRIAAAA